MRPPLFTQRFLNSYHREISYLRHSGDLFAQQYPKIARRLQLSSSESPDPHIERLLESFAFLTAQLNQDLEDRVPQLAQGILEILYPAMAHPIPSFAIAHFKPDPSKGKMTCGFSIPAQTPLFSTAAEGITCRFRTLSPVTLFPLSIEDIEITEGDEDTFGLQKRSRWFLKVRLRSLAGPLSSFDLGSLRVHLSGERSTAFALYDCLFGAEGGQVFQSTPGKKPILLPPESLSPQGFQETLLPQGGASPPGFHLIQDYFLFPEKFLFFDIGPLLPFPDTTEVVDLFLGLEGVEALERFTLQKDFLKLGCTPIVNLFSQTTDPLRHDHRQWEYRLVPDQRREKTTEIYSIQQVASTPDEHPETVIIPSYFSFETAFPHTVSPLRWVSRRVSTSQPDLSGTDVMISFVDQRLSPILPTEDIFFVKTLCTNRFLAEQLPAGALLQTDDPLPVSHISCLEKPTSPLYSPQEGEALWRFIRLLSSHHLMLTSLPTLQDLLGFYAFLAQQSAPDFLTGLSEAPVTRRWGEGPETFIRGTQITLETRQKHYTGNSVVLFGQVLRHFFAYQAPLNSFVQCQMSFPHAQGDRIQWPPLSGTQLLQ